MSSPLCAWSRLAVGFGLLACSSFSLFAQTTFVAQGTEYLPIGALSGDQVNASVSINRNGGYIVWQETGADIDGIGIVAQRLDSSLSSSFGRFVVNRQPVGDQEKPQVAMLANGGTIFVWQSGTRTSSDIVARFMGPNGTFITDDVVVNTYTNGVQSDPVVTVLNGGTIVVSWMSQGQDGSLQGVYAQLLTAAGEKLGGEFRINQYTSSNQRNVSISALAGGGFVAVWASDLQLGGNRADLFGRTFDSLGTAVTGEFQVNSGIEMTANPVVSGRADGGFVAVWTQKQLERTNSLDVVYRRFNSTGVPAINPTLLNTTTFGDQYRPKVTPLGAEHLVVWTSLGQDGSKEGVYGRFLGDDGNPSGSEMRLNQRTISQQMLPALAADGYGKLFVAWSSFYAGTSFDIVARRYSALRAVPQPAAPLVYALDSTSLSVTWPVLAGFDVSGYEVYVDGAAEPAFVQGNFYMLTSLQPGSTHTFRLVYKLSDGRRSAPSAEASGTTWGADLNGDGLPDDWQNLYWGKDGGSWSTAGSDTDGDGATDLAEFLAGTNPLDAESVLKTELLVLGAQLSLKWNTQPGFIYQVQQSVNLAGWSASGVPRFATGTTDSVLVERAAGLGYYRVIRVR